MKRGETKETREKKKHRLNESGPLKSFNQWSVFHTLSFSTIDFFFSNVNLTIVVKKKNLTIEGSFKFEIKILLFEINFFKNIYLNKMAQFNNLN